jgi:hypothetical protein
VSERKVKMSESISREDLLDVEHVDLVRDNLVVRFWEMFPKADRVSITLSSGLDDSMVYTVEGFVQ